MTLLLNCNSLPNNVENIHRLSNFTPSHQPTLCNTLYKLPLIDKKIPINVLDVIDMVFFGLLMIFLAYSYLIVRRGTGKGLNFARRYIILPIYYTFLKVSLFSACLSVAYLTVKLYFKTPPWIVYVLGGLVYFIRNTLEESIAFFLLQQSSGRYHMSNVAKVSITWGVFASISWVILMFATNTDDVNDYKHVYYQSIYWIGVGGLLFIFYLWIFLLRCIPILNFGGKIEPRPAVYVYSFYLMVAYGAWTAGGIYYLITKEDIVFCIWFFGNAFFFALRAPIVYYTFYIDSIHWRSIPGVKFNSKGGSIIDNNNAILPRQPDDEESALINSTVSKFGNLRLLDFSRLKIEWKVGQGATATVWKGILDSRREVAIKQFSCPVLDMNIIEEFLTEASLMSKLDHVNIVRYMGLCVQPPDVCLVTEFCHLGSLFDIVHLKRQKFRWEQLVKLAIDCTKGVAYLHSMGIIHRDIKSLNFLLDKYWTVKVADFGQSRHIDYEETMTGNRGTLQWMAPEVIDRKRYSEKADVYSLAVVFFEMYTQHIPFEDFAIQDLLDAVCVQGLRPDIPDECPREFAKLLQECWSADPEQRPNIDQVLARLLRMRPPGVAVFPDFKDKAPRELRFMSLQEGHTS